MSELTSLIKEAIVSVLPNLPEETLCQMVEKLIGQGLESTDDLAFVREEDILEFVRPIQCRKLLAVWKQGKAYRLKTTSPYIMVHEVNVNVI